MPHLSTQPSYAKRLREVQDNHKQLGKSKSGTSQNCDGARFFHKFTENVSEYNVYCQIIRPFQSRKDIKNTNHFVE